jgi:hypothetical protein
MELTRRSAHLITGVLVRDRIFIFDSLPNESIVVFLVFLNSASVISSMATERTWKLDRMTVTFHYN